MSPAPVDACGCTRIGTWIQESLVNSCRRSKRKLSLVMTLTGCLSPSQARQQRYNVSDLQSSRARAQRVEGMRNTLVRKL